MNNPTNETSLSETSGHAIVKNVFEKVMDTTPENISGYVLGTQFEGDGDIGEPIGVWGAIVLGLGLLFGVYILSQTI